MGHVTFAPFRNDVLDDLVYSMSRDSSFRHNVLYRASNSLYEMGARLNSKPKETEIHLEMYQQAAAGVGR